jgi:hypothetical protein
MSWATPLVAPDFVADLTRYESRFNLWAHRHPQVTACLYDLDQFGGEVIVPIVKVHPKVWVDGLVVTNRYYLDSEYLLADEVEDLVRDGVSAGESPRPPPRGGRPFWARGAGCSSACIDSGAWPRSPSWPTRWPGAPHELTCHVARGTTDLGARPRPPGGADPPRAGGAGHPPGPRARPG